jgi:hypothetical protein
VVRPRHHARRGQLRTPGGTVLLADRVRALAEYVRGPPAPDTHPVRDQFASGDRCQPVGGGPDANPDGKTLR